MNNFREINDDILRDWLSFREEMVLGTLTKEDKKHYIYFDEIAENILKNVPKQNQKYVKSQLDRLDKNFMDYICYWMRNIIGMDFVMEYNWLVVVLRNNYINIGGFKYGNK